MSQLKQAVGYSCWMFVIQVTVSSWWISRSKSYLKPQKYPSVGLFYGQEQLGYKVLPTL